MTLVSDQLKDGVRKLIDRLNSPDYPANAQPPTVVEARMTGPQSSEAKWPSYTVSSDEPPSMGGKDAAPPPSSVFVAAIGFAENVIFARSAALAGLDFDSLTTKVEAHWDRRGLAGIGGTDPSITRLLIETRISTAAPPARIAGLVRLNDSRCPMTATMAKAAAVDRRLFVNGTESPV